MGWCIVWGVVRWRGVCCCVGDGVCGEVYCVGCGEVAWGVLLCGM